MFQPQVIYYYITGIKMKFYVIGMINICKIMNNGQNRRCLYEMQTEHNKQKVNAIHVFTLL